MYCEAHAYLRLFYFHESKITNRITVVILQSWPVPLSSSSNVKIIIVMSALFALSFLSKNCVSSVTKRRDKESKIFWNKNISGIEYFIHLWVSLSCYLSSQTLVVEIIINILCQCAHAGGYTTTTTIPPPHVCQFHIFFVKSTK